MELTVSVQRAKEAIASLWSLTQWIDRQSLAAMEAQLSLVTAHLEGQVKDRTPVVTGVLRDSVFSEVNTHGVSVEGLVSTPIVYGPPVEFGRKTNDNGKGGFEGRRMFERAWNESSSTVSRLLNEVGVSLAADLLNSL